MDEKKENIRSKQLKKALALTETSQLELAKKMNISQAAVAQWVSGARKPSIDVIERIAALLELPVDFFLSAKTETLQEYLKRAGTRTDWMPIVGMSSASGEKYIIEEIESYSRIPKTGQHQFGIKVEGDCMVNPKDPKNSIYNGEIIIVDPDRMPKNGDIVLARISKEYSTIKRMYVKGEKIELRPDNPNFKKLTKKVEDVEIVGTVVASMNQFQI